MLPAQTTWNLNRWEELRTLKIIPLRRGKFLKKQPVSSNLIVNLYEAAWTQEESNRTVSLLTAPRPFYLFSLHLSQGNIPVCNKTVTQPPSPNHSCVSSTCHSYQLQVLFQGLLGGKCSLCAQTPDTVRKAHSAVKTPLAKREPWAQIQQWQREIWYLQGTTLCLAGRLTSFSAGVPVVSDIQLHNYPWRIPWLLTGRFNEGKWLLTVQNKTS